MGIDGIKPPSTAQNFETDRNPGGNTDFKTQVQAKFAIAKTYVPVCINTVHYNKIKAIQTTARAAIKKGKAAASTKFKSKVSALIASNMKLATTFKNDVDSGKYGKKTLDLYSYESKKWSGLSTSEKAKYNKNEDYYVAATLTPDFKHTGNAVVQSIPDIKTSLTALYLNPQNTSVTNVATETESTQEKAADTIHTDNLDAATTNLAALDKMLGGLSDKLNPSQQNDIKDQLDRLGNSPDMTAESVAQTTSNIQLVNDHAGTGLF